MAARNASPFHNYLFVSLLFSIMLNVANEAFFEICMRCDPLHGYE